LEYRDRGEHLVHGTQAELSFGRISYLPDVIGHAPSLIENNLAVVRDEDRTREGIRSTHLCNMSSII
jgi:hypothetical protein